MGLPYEDGILARAVTYVGWPQKRDDHVRALSGAPVRQRQSQVVGVLLQTRPRRPDPAGRLSPRSSSSAGGPVSLPAVVNFGLQQVVHNDERVFQVVPEVTDTGAEKSPA